MKGEKAFHLLFPHNPLLTLCQFCCYSNNSICFRFQQVVSVLELIHDVVGSLVILVDLLLRLIRICRRIWSIWTARQPGVVANDHLNEIPLANINYGQNDIPPTDAEADATNGQNDVIVNEEQNIWTHRFGENLSCTNNTTFTASTIHNM